VGGREGKKERISLFTFAFHLQPGTSQQKPEPFPYHQWTTSLPIGGVVYQTNNSQHILFLPDKGRGRKRKWISSYIMQVIAPILRRSLIRVNPLRAILSTNVGSRHSVWVDQIFSNSIFNILLSNYSFLLGPRHH